MPTVPQLPPATAVGPSDKIMLDQAGQSYSVTTQVLLSNLQPQLTLAQGALLGRVSANPGGPEPVAIGPGLVLAGGVLAADTNVMATTASPSLTGRPTAPTQSPGDNSQALATTAFVAANPPIVQFNGDMLGSGAANVTLVLPPITSPGSYSKVAVNAKGQVVSGGAVAASDIVRGLGYTPYDSANPQGFLTSANLGSMAAQSAGAVSITGGTIGSADISTAVARATGGTAARSVAERAADRLNALDFGADPTGVADSAPAFVAAMAVVPVGGTARVFVPRGVYALSTTVGQPAGRSISVEFDDGAKLIGPGSLTVDWAESHQGPYRLSQNSGVFGPFSSGFGNPANPAFDSQTVRNTPANSAAAGVAWSRDYSNLNQYSKFAGGNDIGWQNTFSWPALLDGTPACGRHDVVTGAMFDEDTGQRASLKAALEYSAFEIVNNGPESGYSAEPGAGNQARGMSMHPWAQHGAYGGHALYAYSSAGTFDGNAAGLNCRWVSYPAVHSAGNPPTVPRGSTLSISMDVTAKALATLTPDGRVSSVAVTNGGGAYTAVPTVVFSGGGGNGASGVAVLVANSVTAVTITSAGSGYSSAPLVTFLGGGIASPNTAVVTLNPDGAHGDLASVAAAIRGANIPLVSAAVANWGGVVSRLVLFGTADNDLGTLILGGTALNTLGIAAQSYMTLRDSMAVAFGGGSVATGDKLTVNGTTLTVGGSGSLGDVAAAINGSNQPGLRADVTAGGRLVMTASLIYQPCGLVLSQPAGFSTLDKLALSSGVVLPPTPPKAFASALGDLGAPACKATDVIRIGATDLAGNVYGPVAIPLNGGAGTGSVADVVASIQAGMRGAGWLSATAAKLSAPPAIVACFVQGDGGRPGIVIRNTAGGTLTIGNVSGTPLDTLGLAAGTYQPGGYSAGCQTVYHAAVNAISPQGRGLFVGGSTVPDTTAWPHAPAEFRGSFAHGIRMDRAGFGDGNALLLGPGQAIGWGVGGPQLTASGTALTANVPAILPALSLTQLPTSAAGLSVGSVWNNGGVLSIV